MFDVAADLILEIASAQHCEMAGRRVSLSNIHNMRDLGGITTATGGKTRSGIIFRSGKPSKADLSDRDALKQQLQIHTIVDLRGKKHEDNEVRSLYPVTPAAGALKEPPVADIAVADCTPAPGTVPIKYMNEDVRNGMVTRMGWLRIAGLLLGFGSAKVLTILKSWMPTSLQGYIGQLKGRLQVWTLHHTICQG